MKLDPRTWSTADVLTAAGLLVAVLAGVLTITTPEIRQALGLDPKPEHAAPIVKGSLYNDIQSSPSMRGGSKSSRPATRTISEPSEASILPKQPTNNNQIANEPPNNAAEATQVQPGDAFYVRDNGLLFVLKSCKRLDRNVSCNGSITSRADKERRVGLGYSSNAVDNLGNQYNVWDQQLLLGSTGQWQNIQPDLPINFSVTINDVNPSASQINVVLGYGAEEAGPGVPNVQWQKAVFRHIPIIVR